MNMLQTCKIVPPETTKQVLSTVKDLDCNYLHPNDFPTEVVHPEDEQIFVEFPEDMLTDELRTWITKCIEHMEQSHTFAVSALKEAKK